MGTLFEADSKVPTNDGVQSWRASLGQQIRDARKSKHLSQKALGDAIGKSRTIITRYESGSDAPSVDVLGRIALALSMTEVNINGYRFAVTIPTDPGETQQSEQLRLEFEKDLIYRGSILEITATKVIVAITPIRVAS